MFSQISIHAPPRGATLLCINRESIRIFQFTPLREGRHFCADIHGCLKRFQFTPLREGRPTAFYIVAETVACISIHAPPRGATVTSIVSASASRFQFTPLREGRRLMNGRPIARPSNFNSRPSARGDSAASSSPITSFYFNSRPSARGDSAASSSPITSFYFNSRPSARGDSKRYAISANLLFNPYKSAWLNNNATQFVEIILVIFHRIIA